MTNLMKKLKVLSNSPRIEDYIKTKVKDRFFSLAKALLLPYYIIWGGVS